MKMGGKKVVTNYELMKMVVAHISEFESVESH